MASILHLCSGIIKSSSQGKLDPTRPSPDKSYSF